MMNETSQNDESQVYDLEVCKITDFTLFRNAMIFLSDDQKERMEDVCTRCTGFEDYEYYVKQFGTCPVKELKKFIYEEWKLISKRKEAWQKYWDSCCIYCGNRDDTTVMNGMIYKNECGEPVCKDHLHEDIYDKFGDDYVDSETTLQEVIDKFNGDFQAYMNSFYEIECGECGMTILCSHTTPDTDFYCIECGCFGIVKDKKLIEYAKDEDEYHKGNITKVKRRDRKLGLRWKWKLYIQGKKWKKKIQSKK